MTNTFFTSDPHHWHALVTKLRGFVLTNGEPDFQGHADAQARNWDAVVRKDDIVYVLGDIAMNPNKGAFEWFDARPGRKILIAGNHDEVASFHSKASKAQRKWMEHFESIHDFLQIKVGGRRVLLSHYPYSGEGDRDLEDRHTQYRLRDEGQPLLHGHIHQDIKVTGTHSYHVGLDAHNLQLVPASEIEAWLETVPPASIAKAIGNTL